jgi:hypothetical protein
MAMLVEMKNAMKETKFYPIACRALDLRKRFDFGYPLSTLRPGHARNVGP